MAALERARQVSRVSGVLASEVVCVTGASGCLGSALVPRLQADGAAVRAFVRPGARSSGAESPAVVRFEGDLRDTVHLTSALAGATIAVHLAALVHVQETRHRWEDFHEANVGITRRLYEASRAAGVRRFVFVSSVVAVGATSDGLISEETPCRPLTMYGRSKLLAEQELLELSASGPPELVILRPSLVYGEHDRGNFGRMLRAASRGRFVIPAGEIRKSLCYAGNAAHAIALAAGQPQARGRTYLLSDEPAPTLRELVRLIARGLGAVRSRQPLVPTVPLPLLLIAAMVGDACARLGLPALLTTDQLRTLAQPVVCDTSRITRELGYVPPTPLAQGIERAVAWSHEHGLL